VEAEAEEEMKLLRVESWMIMPVINDPVVDLSPDQLDVIVGHANRCNARMPPPSGFGLLDVQESPET
jgi:hypothetical protein